MHGESDGRSRREPLAVRSTVAQAEKGLLCATLLTKLPAWMKKLVTTVQAPIVLHSAHGSRRKIESEKSNLPSLLPSRATVGLKSALALRHTDGARMGVGACIGTSQPWCRPGGT